MPWSRSSRICRARDSSITGRPNGRPDFVPVCLAFAMPALMRSWISALELGEHAEHLKERAACGRAGIDALTLEVQVDPSAVELTQEPHEIDGPGGDHV
jgi:hypothetical protein